MAAPAALAQTYRVPLEVRWGESQGMGSGAELADLKQALERVLNP